MKIVPKAVIVLIFGFFLSCVSLNSNDEVSWEVNYFLPLFKERITVSKLGLQSLNISDDSTRLGDTLFLQRIDSLPQQYKSTLFSIPEDKNYQYDGSLLLSRLNTITSSMNLLNLNTISALLKSTASSALFRENVSRDTVYLGPISTINFGDNSDSLPAVVKNTSDSTTVYDLDYKIISEGDTISFTLIDSLRPGDSVMIYAPIANKSIGSSIIIESGAQLDSTLVSDLLKNITFSTDLNGLPFSSGIVSDSAFTLDFSHTFSIPFGQTGFDIGHIDITKLHFPFTLTNSLPIEYTLNVTIDHIWSKDYCSQHEIKSFTDLSSTERDSQYYEGRKLTNFIISSTDNNSEQTYTISFENSRVLPQWNADDTINTLTINISGTMTASGQLVTINSDAKTQLAIQSPEVLISSIYGAYATISKVTNTPTKIPLIPQSEEFDLIRQLKNKLVPQNTDITMRALFKITDSTLFESVKLSGVIFETDTSAPIDTFLIEMKNISANKEFTYSYSLENILRQLPDSIGYLLSYIIEPGKTIFLDSNTLHHENSIVQAQFDADVTLDMKALLVWGISDTVHITFDRTIGSFPITPQTVDLMENKELTLSINIFNNSNIIGRLRATSGNDAVNTTHLLGENGLLIPKRGTVVDNVFSFNQSGIENITSPDSLDIAWVFDIYPSDADALRDTDYIEISAEMVLKGEQSTKGLFGP